jgi:CcmD family protein
MGVEALFLVCAIIWIAIFVFLFSLHRKVDKLASEIEKVREKKRKK